MRIRLALAALLGVVALLCCAGTTLAAAAQASTSGHQAASKGRSKGKGKKGKKKGKGKPKKHKAAKGKTPTKTVSNVTLTGGTATLTLTPTAASTLEKLKVTLTAATPATLPSPTEVSLPVSGGSLNPSTGEGTVDLGGGFTFLGPEISDYFFTSQAAVSLEAPLAIKLAGATSSVLTANVGNPPVNGPFFDLKAGKPKSAAGSITLEGILANLSSPASTVLNDFGSNSFATGQTLADITVNATS
jgi:hypothetical protein